jgi:putative ABC transport system ATP-binding protein
MTPRSPLVALAGVSRAHRGGQVLALHGVSLDIAAGEYVAITGPSGCGKTTLLHVICGIDEPTAGSVAFEGRVLSRRREWTQARARRIGVVYQAFNLFPTLNARENIEVAMFGTIRGRRARVRRAHELLGRVGLRARADHRPGELSGGEQQRVAIARSLANYPRLLLADEPTGNLDSQSAAQVLSLLEACRKDDDFTLVVATHDAEIAARARRVLTMRDGQVVSDQSNGS